MTSRTSEGYLHVNPGSVYYKYDVADYENAESRPVLLFMHAGVADHTLWDEQVTYLVDKGWNCLRFDLFGFGRSLASEEYLRSDPRPPFDPIEHIDLLRREVLPLESTVVTIGLSIGGSLALGYAVQRSDSVSGMAILAGGVLGFEYPNTPQEDALFEKADALIADGDVQGAANLQVRIWGDGPLQEPGRMAEPLAERMLKWNIEISARECARRGGCNFDTVRRNPPAGSQLHTIDIPTAVAYGTYDETYTTAAMKYVASKVKGATVKEFETAHMINLELPDEFNKWLGDWLEANFLE